MVYSAALFELAIDKGMVREYSRELEVIKQVISQNPEYIDFLFSQIVSDREKFTGVDEVFYGFEADILSFIKLLCVKQKIRELTWEIKNFHRLENEFSKVLPIKVFTAIPLDMGQKEILISKLEKLYPKKISPIFELDRSVIGGVRLIIGDKVIERSAAGSLKAFREVVL